MLKVKSGLRFTFCSPSSCRFQDLHTLLPLSSSPYLAISDLQMPVLPFFFVQAPLDFSFPLLHLKPPTLISKPMSLRNILYNRQRVLDHITIVINGNLLKNMLCSFGKMKGTQTSSLFQKLYAPMAFQTDGRGSYKSKNWTFFSLLCMGEGDLPLCSYCGILVICTRLSSLKIFKCSISLKFLVRYSLQTFWPIYEIYFASAVRWPLVLTQCRIITISHA